MKPFISVYKWQYPCVRRFVCPLSVTFLKGEMETSVQKCIPWIVKIFFFKSRIRETKDLLTDADKSTDNTIGWTKNTQKPEFFAKLKKSSKTQKHKNI